MYKFSRVYKKEDGDTDFIECVWITDDSIEIYLVDPDVLRPIGSINKTTVEELGWTSKEDYIKERLQDYECIDLIKRHKG